MNATACSSWISVPTTTLFWARVLMDYKTKQSRGPGKILDCLSFSGYQYLDSASSNKWK